MTYLSQQTYCLHRGLSMKTVLFFPYTNQLGSTIPSVTLANQLREAGHRVVYASQGKYTHVLEQKGFEVKPINEISYAQYRRHVDRNNVDFYAPALIHHFIDQERNLIDAVKPDLIVTNNRPTMKITTQLAQLPMATIVIPALTRYYNHHYFIPENHFLNTLYPFGDVNKVTPAWFRRTAFLLTMKQWAIPFNKVLRSFKLPAIQDFLSVYEGDVTLINQTKGLMPFRDLPANWFFLEQSMKSTHGTSHTWLDALKALKNTGCKIIYVSMGSSSLKSYPLVMKAIARLVDENPNYALVSSYVGMENTIHRHARIFLEPFIHAPEIMPLADVMVTHGGVNTLSECMLQGIPVVGVPEQGEQLWNLKYAEHQGTARVVSRFQLEKNPQLILDAIQEVISNPGFQQKARSFAEDIRHQRKNDLSNRLIEAALSQWLG